MNKEIWKDIERLEGRYQISNLGRVKSLPKFVNNNPKSKNIGYETKERILKPFYNGKGYMLVKMYKDNKKYTKKIHRLVAQAFIPNIDNLPQINHKDENKQNNKADNLEWCDNWYNSHYGSKNRREKLQW